MSSPATREDLAGLIELREDALFELQRAVAGTHDEAAALAGGGLAALNLERALISLAAAGRELQRARLELER